MTILSPDYDMIMVISIIIITTECILTAGADGGTCNYYFDVCYNIFNTITQKYIMHYLFIHSPYNLISTQKTQ